ncbi:hypothetical protein GCM10025881_08180 [Pseudolysinimonas kribbensis]|uniref:Methyltransferase type 12 domain-containing protein n=1 Tax=Pseudolysinimonas kribbensis TaxID=433641 RepID=A0ABQ6K3W3_9MICO|nr:class I SAM-dependent methyltransferase [Pseudolysinimonas kribbensis]GMA93994.1 hypothetical protein GCM10025881_08180 [Pseudolysinimonas kribbensis]
MRIDDGRDGADYVEVNRANWDDRARAHDWAGGYDLQRFVDDPTLLSGVVEFDRPLLGEIAGIEAVHLQCHIGTDTLSLARLGARMTGLDLSPASLGIARRLAADAGADIRYLESNVYDALDVLGTGSFDLVYTGIGALCWLPSIDRWAATVAGLLRAGGRLLLRDAHPVLLSIGEEHPERLEIGLPYFETPNPTCGTSNSATFRPSARWRRRCRTSGTTGSASWSRRCSSTAWSSRHSWSTAPCRGPLCPSSWSRTR